MFGSATLTNQFRAKWGKEERFNQIDGYLGSRCFAIDNRLAVALRYVEPSPENRLTYSYEFSSLLRDCGSVFDSTMRELLTLTRYPSPRSQYDIRDYRRFLRENVNRQGFHPSNAGVETIVLTVNSSWARRFLMPFAGLEDDNKLLAWWEAFNDVKHSDLEKISQGNLVNCLNAFGALASMNALVGTTGGWTQTLGRPLFIDPIDEIAGLLF
jgi:hypothetical protein